MARNDDKLASTRWTLIQRLKNLDDQESWKEFFDLYWKLIFGMACKSGLRHHEAQDVVQDTVMTVMKHIPTLERDPARGGFKSWLFTIVRSRIIDHVRKRERDPIQHAETPPAQADTTKTPFIERLPDPAGNTLEAQWESEWERHLVTAALEKLEKQTNAAYYQIFVLHVIKQHSVEKVAKITGVSANQVYLVKHRLAPLFQKAIKSLEDGLT